jgi:hypothetical protein
MIGKRGVKAPEIRPGPGPAEHVKELPENGAAFFI